MSQNTGPLDPAGNPAPAPPKSGPAPAGATASHDTGPLDAIKDALGSFFRGSGEPKARKHKATYEQAPGKEQSAIEKMRDKLADFDEDYKDIGERLLGAFVQAVGYLGPFLLVIWVGSDLGKYFLPVMDLIPAYGLAYTIEGIIASLSVAMGRAFAEVGSGKPNYGKTALVVIIWAILNASSAFGLYLVITHNGQVTSQIEQVSMVIRVCAIALGDLGCAAVLMFKGRSIQKHIESIRKRASAIGELADAQRGIEEADKNAALREQMMKSTLKIQEDLSNKIGDAVSMVMESILDKMEKSLKDDSQGKKERGYGQR
jgi:hypothetical protein